MNDMKTYSAAVDVFDGTAKNKKTGRDAYVCGRALDFFTSSASPFVAQRTSSTVMATYIAESNGVVVKYSGAPLTVFDEDLLYAITMTQRSDVTELPSSDAAKEYGYERCTFETSCTELLRLMGYAKKTENINKVKERIRQLQATSIQLRLPDDEWGERGFSIISEYMFNEKKGRVHVKFSPLFLRLYLIRNHYSACLEMRKQLRSSIGRRLISYLERWKKFRDGHEMTWPLKTVCEAIKWQPLPSNRTRELKKISQEFKKKLGVELELIQDKKTGCRTGTWKLKAKKISS